MTRPRITSLCLFGLVAGAVLVATSAPAFAQSDDRDDDDTRVVLTGRVDIAAGERVDTVVIFDGHADIAGDVDGSVVAFNGDIRVTGRVDDDVVAFNGRAIIEDGAMVDGDVISSDRPRVAAGATVGGDIERARFDRFFRSLGWVLWLYWWLAVTVSVFVLGVVLLWLFPSMFPPAIVTARNRVGASIAWGLAVGIGLPILSVVVMFTVVGIPLGILGLLSVALLYGLGYIVAALALGRRILPEPRSLVLAFLVGWLILRVIDLIPVLGNLVTLAAAIYGLGALAVATRSGSRRAPTQLSPTAPAPV